ncbi:MAG: formylglycine-generating enzyme family protein, partial [Anaerolineae bacterium]
GDDDEMPEHTVTLSGYFIEIDEVTNAEYRECVNNLACTDPFADTSPTRSDYFTNPAYDNYPVMWVDRARAIEYCQWAGRRLPTEAEWEKAARGGCELVAPSTCGSEDERTYPWGEASPSCSRANYKYGEGLYCVGAGDTAPVGARSPAGDSPYGVHDMAGNLFEWVADWYGDTYYASSPSTNPPGPGSGDHHIVRGGSWLGDVTMLRTAAREPANTENLGWWYQMMGFRCAKSL